MSSFDFRTRVMQGPTVFMSWVSMPEPLVAEATARAGFDAVNIDMQHGLHDPVSVMRAIGGVAAAGKPAVVRVPLGDFAMASRALDMGASAVIAPMINTVADARAFAEATKFPPLGKRSWGPARAMTLRGETDGTRHLASVNGETLALAMIETREALDNLEAILDVDGIDGAFVGPSDLSITLSDGAYVNGDAPIVDEPVRRILAAAEARGKVAAIYAISGARARQMAVLGYRLVAIAQDQLYLAQGAKAMLAEARG
ncbi:HpcH/HpaI aldolase family protein [Prosthecomicrobium sp. N25]|uniref:HpcH/HpaI aldolase family protein n=1 Tax=Prosthecomicrobium sp. N25 TaxID=3129254 RepID=UPI0030769ABE